MKHKKTTALNRDLVKRLFSFFLCFIFVLVFIASETSTTVMAATTPTKITQAQALAKIDKLTTLLKGKYFTVNQKACTKHKKGDTALWSCCTLSKIISPSKSWLEKSLGMGELNYNLMPAQYLYSTKTKAWVKGSVNGDSCYGFANFAHWYIFAQKNTDNVVSTLVCSNKPMTKETIEKARPGDVIRTKTHSMIFISYDKNGFWVLDSNSDFYSSKVLKRYVSFDKSKYVAITGVTNYDRNNTGIVKVTGIKIDAGNLCINVGAKFTVPIIISPSNATNKNVTWSSSNPGVATVSSAGVVKGVAAGKTVITVKTVDGAKTATINIQVLK